MTRALAPGRLRLAARGFVALLALSTGFPVVASLLATDHVPTWLGILDVAVAAVTVVVGFAIDAVARPMTTVGDASTAYRALRGLALVLLVLLALFFVQPSLLQWDVLLVGLAWRAWLLIWVLPSVLAALRGSDTAAAAA